MVHSYSNFTGSVSNMSLGFAGLTEWEVLYASLAAGSVYYLLARHDGPKIKNTKSHSLTRMGQAVGGEGLPLIVYVIFSWLGFVFTPEMPELRIPYLMIIGLVHCWTFPFGPLAEIALRIGEGLMIIHKIRRQLPNIVPYGADLFEFLPHMLMKKDIMIANIDVLGEAMPEMMKHKKYILPVMGQIINKIEFIIPTIPVLMPNLAKVAPKISILMPKIEILAPYIADLMPLWDDLEPHLETMVEELDHLAPVLPQMTKNMGKMIPVMNMMPLVHETGAFKLDFVTRSLPFVTSLLPRTDQYFRRFLLEKATDAFVNIAEESLSFVRRQEQKMVEFKRIRATKEERSVSEWIQIAKQINARN